MVDIRNFNWEKKVKLLRTALDLTQEQAAKKTNITQEKWSRMESEKYVPDVFEAKIISKVLGVTISDLFFKEEKE